MEQKSTKIVFLDFICVKQHVTCIQKNVEIWPYIHKWLFQHWTVPLRVKKKKSIVPAMQRSQHCSKGHKEILVYKTKASYY